MISIHFVGNQLRLKCTTAEESAQFDAWCETTDPQIVFKTFYGMSHPGPEEYTEKEGGLHLSQVGYITRQIGETLWNSKVLK